MSLNYNYNSRVKDDLVEFKITSTTHFEKLDEHKIYYYNPLEANDLIFVERTAHNNLTLTYKLQRPEHKVITDFEAFIKKNINILEIGHVYLMDGRENYFLLNLTKKTYYPLYFKNTFPPKHSDILCISKDKDEKALIINFAYADLAFTFYLINNIIPLLGFYAGHSISEDFLSFIQEYYKRGLTYQKEFLTNLIPSCWTRLTEDIKILPINKEEPEIENRLSAIVNVKLSQLLSGEISIKNIKSSEVLLDVDFPLKEKMRFVRIQDGELNFYPIKDVKATEEVIKYFSEKFSLKFIYFS